MPELILKVQPTGASNSYRLGVSKDDSIQYFRKRHTPVRVILGNLVINTRTTCGNDHKGFDLYDREIRLWIIGNKYHIYPKGRPTKLRFLLNQPGGRLIISFLGAEQAQ